MVETWTALLLVLRSVTAEPTGKLRRLAVGLRAAPRPRLSRSCFRCAVRAAGSKSISDGSL
jgi:hypothetical protein